MYLSEAHISSNLYGTNETLRLKMFSETGTRLFYKMTQRIFTEGVVGWREVLGKLPVPGRPTDLDYSRARAYCACGRCGWGLFGHFFSHLSLLFSFSLSLGDGPI